MDTQPKTMADFIRAELAETGVSQRAAARALGIDERLMRRYCTEGGDAPPYVLMALQRLTQVAFNQRVIRMFEDGTLSASDGEASRQRLLDNNAALVKAIDQLVRRDRSDAGIVPDTLNLTGGLEHVEPGDVIVDRNGKEGIVQHMLDNPLVPKCACRVKTWTDSSRTHFQWRESIQFILPQCALVSRATDEPDAS